MSKKLDESLTGPGWRAKRKKEEPWFYWVYVTSAVETEGWSDIPGVGFDGIRRAWVIPEEVLSMLLLEGEP